MTHHQTGHNNVCMYVSLLTRSQQTDGSIFDSTNTYISTDTTPRWQAQQRDSQNENQPSQATDMKLSCQFLQQQSACFVANCTLANFPHHYHYERQQAGRRADAMATSSSQRLCFFLEPNILSLCISICVRSVLFTKSSGENREEEENLNCKNYHMPRAKKECEREYRATQRPEHSEPIQDLSEGQ